VEEERERRRESEVEKNEELSRASSSSKAFSHVPCFRDPILPLPVVFSSL
jgi:hypothetical protein